MNLISELKLEGYVVEKSSTKRDSYSGEIKKFFPTEYWNVYRKSDEKDPIMSISKYGFFGRPEISVLGSMTTDREKERIKEISKPFAKSVRVLDLNCVE
jgi:hypothetical protein